MPRIASLVVYPLKSARGLSVGQFELDHRGPRGDRRWMLADPAGKFVSLRSAPRLAFVSAESTADGLRIALSDGSVREVPRPVAKDSAWVTTRLWDDDVRALAADEAVGAWLSTFLGLECRLVYLPDDAEGPEAPEYGSFAGTVRQVALSDGAPMLLASEASLADLNARLPRQIAMHRFRPNIIVDGTTAWEEDEWRQLDVGDVTLRVVKGCARCVATTVEEVTATRGVEPLRTLATFRKRGSEVYFGQYVEHLSAGTMSVGMPVRVIA